PRSHTPSLFPYTTLFRSHPVRPGVHLQQPVETPSGFIQYVDDPVRAPQTVGEVSIGKHFPEIAVSRKEMIRGIRRSHRILQVIRDRKSTRLNSSHVKISY